MFKNAIVRRPGANFAEGLTTVKQDAPIHEKVLEQHERYCEALRQCGLSLMQLEADPRYPDATFVEDTAILAERCAILTRPGAISREGEVAGIQAALAQFYPALHAIRPPGTLDGGDICQAGDHFFIGISNRTNEDGAQQLAGLLAEAGYTSSDLDIRALKDILHLKSGLAYLGDKRLVVIEALAHEGVLRDYELVRVAAGEEYAANCVRVNDSVLLAAGYPRLEKVVRGLGYPVMALETSEFQKMDGGLSCLSLRF